MKRIMTALVKTIFEILMYVLLVVLLIAALAGLKYLVERVNFTWDWFFWALGGFSLVGLFISNYRKSKP
jgi:hypothetical protein